MACAVAFHSHAIYLLYLISSQAEINAPNAHDQGQDDSKAEENGQPQNAEVTSIADSEESLDEQEEPVLPLLCLAGMDQLHRDAGESSVQGLSRTMASAVEAAGKSYKLIIHGNENMDDKVPLMNDSGYLPAQLAGATTKFRDCYKRYIACEWNATAHAINGSTEGQWNYLDGGGYKVVWEEDVNGECSNSSIARLPESTT